MHTLHAVPTRPSTAGGEPPAGELLIRRYGASRRGFWPRPDDEGLSIRGTYLGTVMHSTPSRRRQPLFLIEGVHGQAWYVPRTKALARDIRRLRLQIGDHVRLAFLGMRRNGHRDVRRIVVEQILNGTNGG